MIGSLTPFVGLGGTSAAAAAASPAQLLTITIPDSQGEIPSTWLGYPGPPRAEVWLPPGYNPNQRYPLLLLLHGLNSHYDWYAQSGLTSSFAGLDAIVVMPEGASGWYTDWWNNGARGGPAWESYDLNDVIPAVLARFPILPGRQYHAIAGISMGGLGSTYLGGRLPGFFGSVASLSGFDDLSYYPYLVEPGMALTAEAPLHGDNDADPVDGEPLDFYFDGHDPSQLVHNLQNTRVFISSGTGHPSAPGIALATHGGLANVLGGSVAEAAVIYPMNQRYVQALLAAGINVTYQFHPGGHDIPDFASELQAMIAWGLFKPVVSDPGSWTNSTVATSGQLWDISYHFSSPPTAVVQFQQVGN
ncbi:MAG TPA: alpha/beta hydrolase-fold protein, partial [Acidimicrobiales bacterium]